MSLFFTLCIALPGSCHVQLLTYGIKDSVNGVLTTRGYKRLQNKLTGTSL